MNPEEREEYHEQIKKAKKLAEKEEDKGTFYVVRGYLTKWRIDERDNHLQVCKVDPQGKRRWNPKNLS